MVTAAVVFAPVQPIFQGETIVCLGSGPSLTQDDVDYCRGRARVIAIKDTYRLASWADVLYSADERWWQHHAGTLQFGGLKFALVSPEQKYIDAVESAGAHLLKIGGATGIDPDPTQLRTGNHSGYSATNLAVHLGAARIVYLGYDMKRSADGRDHYFGAHPYHKKPPPYQWLDVFTTFVEPLRALGIDVINASRETALTLFPRMSIQDALL